MNGGRTKATNFVGPKPTHLRFNKLTLFLQMTMALKTVQLCPENREWNFKANFDIIFYCDFSTVKNKMANANCNAQMALHSCSRCFSVQTINDFSLMVIKLKMIKNILFLKKNMNLILLLTFP